MKLRFLILLTVIVTTACSTTTVRQHPNFATNPGAIKTISMLPTDVTVTKLVLNGENEPIYDKQEYISNYLNTQFKDSLNQKGFTVSVIKSEQFNEQDENFSFNVEQVKKAYDTISLEIYKTRAMKTEQAHQMSQSVGEMVNEITSLTNSDALLITKYVGYQKSGGTVAKDVAASVLFTLLTGTTPVSATKGGYFEMALIDGVSGDVLWTNASGGDLIEHSLINTVSRPFPNSANLASSATVETVGTQDKDIENDDEEEDDF